MPTKRQPPPPPQRPADAATRKMSELGRKPARPATKGAKK